MGSKSSALLAVSSGLGAALCQVAAGQCTPTWDAFDLPSGLDVYALCVFDDGSGPALYAGGRPATAADPGIVKWTGAAWLPVATLGGQSAAVWAMTVFDADGAGPLPPRLIAAGQFTSVGGAAASSIAQWDGTVWAPLGSGIVTGASGRVHSLLVADLGPPGAPAPMLYVGGLFQAAGGIQTQNIASWDGAWHSVGAGLPGSLAEVFSLAAFDEDGPGPLEPALFAGTQHTPGLYRFRSGAWAPIGGLCCGTFTWGAAMTVFDEDGPGPVAPALYIGGSFNISGTSCWHIARWDGEALSPVADCFDPIHDLGLGHLLPFDADGAGPSPAVLYAGGYIYHSGTGTPLPLSAKLSGSRWAPTGASMVYVPSDMAAFPAVGSDPPALYIASNVILRYRCVPCYANCDQSTDAPALNVNDFICFQSRFAGGDPYANCDGSTTPPILSVNDFICFQSRFAGGCS